MIEQPLYEHLTAQKSLEGYLTKYADKMAIFNQEAPDDTDKGWAKGSQYGRIVYAVKHVSDPQREIITTLSVDYMCKEGECVPEDVEPIIRPLIDGYFFSTKSVTMSARWMSSDYFTAPKERVIGVTLIFQLTAFPLQETTSPDPIALLNSWSNDKNGLVKLLKREVKVIVIDKMPTAWKPTAEEPAIYWRLGKIRPAGWIPDTYNCSWYTATIYGHVMGSDIAQETSVARIIAQYLTMVKRLIFDDESPLMIDRNIQINTEADQHRTGQLVIDATFGVLNTCQMDGSSLLQHIDIS